MPAKDPSAYPILEYDPSPEALIQPRCGGGTADVPQAAVMCFFNEVIAEVCGEGRATQVGQFRWEHGVHPLYRLVTEERPVAVFHPGVGAPLAAGLMEDAIACGCRAFVAAGGAGVLVPGLTMGHIIVPNAAVRDEGTSYHYMSPSREVSADPRAVAVIVRLLEERNVPHTVGKTWTTDAPYRETAGRIRRRREEGCLTVEMESAAFMAVARHRGVSFGQMLYAGDDVSGEAHDDRSWLTSSARKDLFWLAVEAAPRLHAGGAAGANDP